MADVPRIPQDWRRRRGVRPRSVRFEVEGERGSWDLIDWAYAGVLRFDRKSDAEEARRFAKKYVKIHGDIDFGSFPWSVDAPLHYDDIEAIAVFWTRDYP